MPRPGIFRLAKLGRDCVSIQRSVIVLMTCWLISSGAHMAMKLKVCPGQGCKPVIAKNDGGILLEYYYENPKSGQSGWIWKKQWPPVVTIEVRIIKWPY